MTDKPIWNTGLINNGKLEQVYEMATVRHGHWIDCKGSDGKDYRKCSECLHTQNITGLLNYCPICGAKMDESTMGQVKPKEGERREDAKTN